MIRSQVTSGMVISTFLSAPIMYVSAWLLTIPWMDPTVLALALQNVSFNISIVSLFALVSAQISPYSLPLLSLLHFSLVLLFLKSMWINCAVGEGTCLCCHHGCMCVLIGVPAGPVSKWTPTLWEICDDDKQTGTKSLIYAQGNYQKIRKSG